MHDSNRTGRTERRRSNSSPRSPRPVRIGVGFPWTAAGELVADEDGESYISMEDFAVALADRLEEGDAVGTYLGTGY